MTRRVTETVSPRNGFKFNLIPTIRGSIWGGGDIYPNNSLSSRANIDYGQVLDCVFEMADQVSNCNGASASAAVDQVLRDEAWRILPTHRAEIIRRLEA